MATIISRAVRAIWCDQASQQADLIEERVFPDDPIPGPGTPYIVRSRKCSFGIDCNLAGYSCRWAYTNPDYDPFSGES